MPRGSLVWTKKLFGCRSFAGQDFRFLFSVMHRDYLSQAWSLCNDTLSMSHGNVGPNNLSPVRNYKTLFLLDFQLFVGNRLLSLRRNPNVRVAVIRKHMYSKVCPGVKQMLLWTECGYPRSPPISWQPSTLP